MTDDSSWRVTVPAATTNPENEASGLHNPSPDDSDATTPSAALSQRNPYDQSLFGEYSRLLLLLIGLPLVIRFALSVFHHQTGVAYLVAALVLIASFVWSKGHRGFRVWTLIIMALNVFAGVISYSDVNRHHNDPSLTAAAYVLLLCLLTASVFEFSAWMGRTRGTISRTLAWGVLLIPMFVYAVGIPIFNEIWDAIEADEKKMALADPKWNLANEIALRAAKFGVFTVFTYFGACLGSFLNVVAWCLPRGEAIALRSSKCPQCITEISRIDNLPIFSYLNLGGRCRHCEWPIPIRYLTVELVAAFIFGSLFLYQLVTGCLNVPDLFVHHKGILWIILYPKWPAITSYFFHAFFMTAILVLALIEWDQQKLKPSAMMVIGLAFFIPAAIYFPLQPVPLLKHLPGNLSTFSPVFDQVLTLFAGGTVGAAVGRTTAFYLSPKNVLILTMAFFLTGLALGWQALLPITLLFAIASAACRFNHKIGTLLQGCPTTLLLVAILLHHPFWKTIDSWW